MNSAHQEEKIFFKTIKKIENNTNIFSNECILNCFSYLTRIQKEEPKKIQFYIKNGIHSDNFLEKNNKLVFKKKGLLITELLNVIFYYIKGSKINIIWKVHLYDELISTSLMSENDVIMLYRELNNLAIDHKGTHQTLSSQKSIPEKLQDCLNLISEIYPHYCSPLTLSIKILDNTL